MHTGQQIPTTPAAMAAAAARTKQRRDHAAAGTWVVGRWTLDAAGAAGLEALAGGRCITSSPDAPPTRRLDSMARWRTRQGCYQWARTHRRRLPAGYGPLNIATILRDVGRVDQRSTPRP